MNAPSTPSLDIFDVRKIRRLVELMKEHDLNEIDIQQGEVRIQLRRAGSVAVASPVMIGPPPMHHYSPAAMAGPPAPESDASAAADGKSGSIMLIKSPMVGTFYTASDPDSAPFVKIGDHIGPETTVCIVEAMKVFNQIPAEVSGRVIAALVENGAPVEFGQPLFKVDTRE